MTASEIRHATVACSDLESSLRFWRDLVGFAEVWRCEISGRELERAWALPAGAKARIALLRYDGIETGQLRLVEITPHEPTYVRTWDDDPWAIGVGALDVCVRDPERTFALLSEAGYPSRNPHPHYYSLGAFEQSECVFRAPDHVNLLLVGAMNYPPDMARPGVRGHFSALTVVSQFVPDLDAAARFYRDGLGLEESFHLWADEKARPVINEMVGIPANAEVGLACYRAPGNPDGKPLLIATRGVAVRSIVERMQPTSLGIVMMSHETNELDALRRRVSECGGTAASEIGALDFGGREQTRACLVRAPGGALLELYQGV